MKEVLFTVTSNNRIARDTWELCAEGDASDITRPGQFVNVLLPGFYLRRPLSVCDWDDRSLTLIYKAVGSGTEYLAGLLPGAELDALTGLGNGYDTSVSGPRPLLVGGGAGVPPLYALAKRLAAEEKEVSVILGFNTAEELFYDYKFSLLDASVTVTTADGSLGLRGLVTDAMEPGFSCVYACGPEPMLRAVWEKSDCPGQFSFEERMGCGFGACMGCSRKTRDGFKRVCRDGPVFTKEEIVW